jgi:hypothetical protein
MPSFGFCAIMPGMKQLALASLALLALLGGGCSLGQSSTPVVIPPKTAPPEPPPNIPKPTPVQPGSTAQ